MNEKTHHVDVEADADVDGNDDANDNEWWWLMQYDDEDEVKMVQYLYHVLCLYNIMYTWAYRCM